MIAFLRRWFHGATAPVDHGEVDELFGLRMMFEAQRVREVNAAADREWAEQHQHGHPDPAA